MPEHVTTPDWRAAPPDTAKGRTGRRGAHHDGAPRRNFPERASRVPQARYQPAGLRD